MSAIPAKKLLFADACHSGAKLGTHQASNEGMAERMRRTGIVVLASSGGDEFSFEDKSLGHGEFTVALLEALRGMADLDGDGSVTLPELVLYVPRRVSRSTRGLQNPQLVSVQDFNPRRSLVRL